MSKVLNLDLKELFKDVYLDDLIYKDNPFLELLYTPITIDHLKRNEIFITMDGSIKNKYYPERHLKLK